MPPINRALNILYFIISLALYATMAFLWGSSRILFGQIELADYELLFISFFVFNYAYLGVLDFMAKRSVYYELTINSAQVMLNFVILITILLILKGIISGQTKIQLNDLEPLELLSIGLLYSAISTGTNYYFLKKQLK